MCVAGYFQIKLEQAKEFLDEKAEEFKEQGEEGKAKLEEEAKLAGDRVGLELGYAASEIDDSLADLLEETEAAKERNRYASVAWLQIGILVPTRF